MPTLSNRAFHWFCRHRLMLEAEGAGGGSGAAAAAPAPSAVNQFLLGGEMLQGAKVGSGAEEFEHPETGMPEEWTPENAQSDSGDGETIGGVTEETGETEAAAAGKTGDATPAAVPPAADPAAEMKDWPEAARVKAEELTKSLATLSTEKETLAAEVERLKAAVPAPALAPTRENPLANTDERGLAAHETLAAQTRSWALRNLANGGELPRELQAALEGRKPEEITEPRVLTAEEAAGMLERSEAMMKEVIPARREYLKTEKETGEWLAKEYPAFKDPKTVAGALFNNFLGQFPQIKQLPSWQTVLACVVRGHMGFEADTKAKAEAAKGTPPVPIAPTPPGKGSSGGGGASKPAISKPGNKPMALSANMDADDLARVMSKPRR